MSNIEHPSRNSLQKIKFTLQPGEWHGHSSEGLWANEVIRGKYRVENTPFFVKGISYQDIISARVEGDELVFSRKLISAGHSTYRLILTEEAKPNIFQKYWMPLSDIGCTYESGNFGYTMIAVDVPNKMILQKTFDLLVNGQENKAWDFEEGDVSAVALG